MIRISEAVAPVAALLLSVAILLTGNGLLGTLIPVRASLEAFSEVQVGILGSFYYIGFTAGCLAGPSLIARVGHIRTYLAFISVASALALVHALIVEPAVWWCLRALSGFSFAVLYVVIESWLNERADNRTRGTIFSVYTVINLTVITIGQLMLTLADPSAFPLFALCAILVSLASLPVALTRSPSPQPNPVLLPGLQRLFARSPVGFVACFAHGLASGSFWALGPVFILRGGLDIYAVSLFMSATVIGGAVGQLPIGRLSDRIDRRSVLLACCLCAAAAGLLLTFLQGHASWQINLLGFLFGLFSFPIYALAVAHTNDLAAPTDYVETSSGLLLVFGLGCVVGPALAAFLDTELDFRALFLFTAAVHVLLAGYVLQRMLARAPVPAAEKGEFKDALVATRTVTPIAPLGSDVDPRPSARDGGG